MTISTKPKERPILFSAPMVRAILDGRKTVTRRPIKPQPEVREVNMIGPMLTFKNKRGGHWLYPNAKAQIIADCPYGKPGERLWVRETTESDEGRSDAVVLSRYAADRAPVIYRHPEGDEYDGSVAHWDYPRRSRPSIHMPRWACRILLEITDVRVERLQDISEDQAKAEGCFFKDYGKACFHGGKGVRDAAHCELPESTHQQRNGWMWDKTTSHEQCLGSARNAFGNLWQTTGGDWAANPWVWVVEFKRVQP